MHTVYGNIWRPVFLNNLSRYSLQASLPPAKISLPRRVKIVQLSAGLHHTLMLSSDGEVFGFGSNSHGQLGQVRTSLEFYSVSLTGILDCVLMSG